jgi:hypothetical protein
MYAEAPCTENGVRNRTLPVGDNRILTDDFQSMTKSDKRLKVVKRAG